MNKVEKINLDTILIPNNSNRGEKSYLGLHTKSDSDIITIDDVREHGLHPQIVEERVYTSRFGVIENQKAIYAVKDDGTFAHLNTCKGGYNVIDNEQVFGIYEDAFRNIEHTVTAVGTYNNLKNYFIEVQLGGGDEGFEVNGDKFGSNLLFLTSHDGSMALNLVDTNVRYVCENVLRTALGGEKKINFKVHHKGNAHGLIKQIPKCIESVLTGRKHFKEVMEMFASINVVHDDIEAIVAGFFLETAPSVNIRKQMELNGFSTRVSNHIDRITNLAIDGMGNRGENLYDVLNGATEYWTHGEGAGKTTTDMQRHTSSNFGSASDRKVEFANYLRSGRYVVEAEKAQKVLALAS